MRNYKANLLQTHAKSTKEIGKRFTKVSEIATRRSDSSKTNGIPMVLHGSQDRKVIQRRGIRSWSWLGSVTKVITTPWEPYRNVKSHGWITPDVWEIHAQIKKSYNRVTEIAIPRSDGSETNELPMVLHVSRAGKSSQDMASDREVSWQAWQNHYEIVKTMQKCDIPRKGYSRRMGKSSKN